MPKAKNIPSYKYILIPKTLQKAPKPPNYAMLSSASRKQVGRGQRSGVLKPRVCVKFKLCNIVLLVCHVTVVS